MITMPAKTHLSLLCALVMLATVAQAGPPNDIDYWRCPYTPDGSCAPRRQTYGYFAPKWRRWPGVTSADYESKLPPPEPYSPPDGIDTGPRITPNEMLPPSDLPTLNDIPTPPRGDGDGPPPLTPETERQPDTILAPPGEDIMDELLPEDEPPTPPSKPDREPAKEPTEEPAVEPSTRPTPDGDDLLEEKPLDEKPGDEKPADEKPFEGDPFRDDPLFNDDVPAPPGDTKRSELESVPRQLSPSMPAMREVPSRLPTARTVGGAPASRLTKRNVPSIQPTSGVRPAGGDRLKASAGFHNPLRSRSTTDMIADDKVLPTAAWQEPQPTEAARESGWRANPLRNR